VTLTTDDVGAMGSASDVSSADGKVQQIARRQGGFVTREQCRRAGLSDRQIHVRLATRGWTRHHPGVFLLPGHAPSAHGKLLAAQLWGGPDSTFCRSTAAWVHGLTDTLPSRPELYTPGGKMTSGLKTYRLNDAIPCRRVRGLSLTTVERTLFDLCGVWPATEVGKAMDSALRLGLTSLDRLREAPAQWGSGGRRGAGTYARLAEGRDARDPLLRSRFEKKMLTILKRIPSWIALSNYPVTIGSERFFLDFAFPNERLAIECQSIKWHLGEEAFKKDMARHRKLTLAGWTVLFYCWDDVTFAAEAVEAEIRSALAGRVARLV
jgi:hypothetical protein